MLWDEQFSDEFPEWTCPKCGKGHLYQGVYNVSRKEAYDSQKTRSHDEWEPNWEFGTFHARLSCNRRLCQEIIEVIGEYKVNLFEGDEGECYSHYVYSPKAIYPAPLLINKNYDYPDDIKFNIIEASEVFWISFSSCANKLRIVVEVLLSDQGISKIDFPHLHKRIEEFRKKDSVNGDALMALKWLGNLGSHGDSITREEIMISVNILDDVIDSLYAPKERSVPESMINSINSRFEKKKI